MRAPAEARFGTGDGVFPVDAMTNAWGSYFNTATNNEPFRMRTTNPSLRLGMEFTF
jgi:hypothetical protein